MNLKELIEELKKSLILSIKCHEEKEYSNDWTEDVDGKLPFLFSKSKNVIESAYGKNSEYYKKSVELTKEEYYTIVWNKTITLVSLYKLKGVINFLVSVLDEIIKEDLTTSSQISKIEKTNPTSNKVFIVHGRNMQWLDEIENFVNELGYKAVVLYKDIQPGQTIIEKLESHADAFAAVILLTPDDLGKLETDTEFKKRARQNVVFEYGFFSGVIGRKSIILINFGIEEMPSDIHGIALTNTSTENVEAAKKEISIGLQKIKNGLNPEK